MISEVLNLILALTLISSSNSSIVIDSRDQKGIYLSEYCPKMPYCPEGAHVMCMFYNPNSIMGPRCSQPRNVTITPTLAHMLLDILNAIRSKAAQGKEKGKDGQNLPKAYGMFRLKWDNELATFAQVLANQCVLRHDLCRASRRFPDPGQTAGLVRFTMPDWNPVSQNAHFNKIGLTFSKLHYATTQSLKSWYSHKDYVTSDMIRKYPDWSEHPDKLQGRLYLEMVHSGTTHLGCGISAYSEYAYHNNRAELNYNSVQLICNYSARPKKGMPVYSTNTPSEPGMTIRCGCPEGYEEDVDCLCIESNSVPVPTKSCTSKDCKPAIVLLPIFTVEDAPALKMGNEDQNFYMIGDMNETSQIGDKSNDDIFSAFEGKDNEYDDEKPTPYHKIFPSLQAKTYKNDINAIIQNEPNVTRTLPFSRKFQVTQYRPSYRIPNKMAPLRVKASNQIQKNVQHRYFNKDSLRTPSLFYRTKKSLQATPSHVLPNRKITQPKGSIFSRAHQFELPSLSRKYDINSFIRSANGIKRDVAPRKDFSNSQKLLSEYLNNKRHLESIDTRKFLLVHEYLPTAAPSNLVNNSVNLNRFIKNKFHYPDFNTSSGLIKRYDIKDDEDADKKLMTLLDNLEQEVKHIELDVNEKEIFDAKIRKIYGTVVGKPVDLYTSVTNKNHLEDSARDFIDKRVYETEDKVKYLHSKMYTDQKFTRPLKRSQNALSPYDTDSKLDLKRHSVKPKNNYRNMIDSDGQRTRSFESDREDKYHDEDFESRTANKNDDNKVTFEEIRKSYRRPPEEDNSRNYRRDYRPSEYVDVKKKHIKDNYEDPIGPDRRRFYQEKLNNIEMKINGNRNSYRRHSDHEKERALRLVRPSRDELRVRPRSKSQMSPLYMGDRARFLHGF